MSQKHDKTDVTFDNPFFDEVGKYAVRFSAPVIFGDPPTDNRRASLGNATATLVHIGRKYLGVTCHHVITGHRRAKREGRVFFQIGHAEIDPDDRLVDEDASLDLAVIDLPDLVGGHRYLSSGNFVKPTRWPPGSVTKEDVISFAGFPGVWREQVDVGHLRFYSFSSGASEILSVRDQTIVSTIQIEECIKQIDHGRVLGSIGGMSGGPAFVWRTSTILTAELVGFIYEYSATLDLLLIRSASALTEDGSLRR